MITTIVVGWIEIDQIKVYSISAASIISCRGPATAKGANGIQGTKVKVSSIQKVKRRKSHVVSIMVIHDS